jgi:glycosyltransferase involved in cell wall biosynthesis
MKVLVLAPRPPLVPGAATSWTRDLLAALAPRAWTGLLIPRGDAAEEVRIEGTQVFTLPALAPADPAETRRIVRAAAAFARGEEIGIVHLAGAELAPLAPGLAAAGLHPVLTVFGPDLPEIGPVIGGEAEPSGGELRPGAAESALALRDAAGAGRVTALSHSAAAHLAELGIIPSVVPPGIDLGLFQPGDRAAARRELDLPADRPVLVTAARLCLAAGHLDALDGLAEIRDLVPLWVVAGDGPDARRLQARVRFLRLDDHVRFLGAVERERLALLFQAADAALLPAREEALDGAGLAAIEAAACALPVVAARTGALAEIVEDGRTGFLVPPRSPRALAAALLRLLDVPSRAQAIGLAARQRAEREYGGDALGERFLEIYRTALAGGHLESGKPEPPSRPAAPRRARPPRPRPRVAVFLPTWRCREWLPRAIRGILGQTWPQVDLYVADDAGGDVDEALEKQFPEVTFLTLRDQGGPYRIANLLLSLTESELVAFHDADDRSRPDRIAAQVDFLLDRELDACGSWCLLVDLYGDPIGFDTVPEHASEALREQLGDSILHPTTLWRREALDRLGGFDGATRFSGDTELFYRSLFTCELGNVQHFLYERTVWPGSLTQDAETGIHSPARTRYLEKVQETAEAVRTGELPPPPRGLTLLGRPIPAVSPDLVQRLRPGQGNRTLKEAVR